LSEALTWGSSGTKSSTNAISLGSDHVPWQ
jgi:hypothetical protein